MAARAGASLGGARREPGPVHQRVRLAFTLNSLGDPIKPNAAIVRALGAGGGVSTFVTNQMHLILDTNGYFAR